MRSKTKYLFLLVGALWIVQIQPLGAWPRTCSEICTSTTQCNTLCYVTLYDFLTGGLEATCLDYGVYDEATCPTGWTPGNGTAGSGSGATCGNAECDASETCDSCPKDCYDTECGGCGDSICAADEYGGYGPGHQAPQCGPQDVWCSYCPDDCGECDPQACWPQACQGESGRYQCGACSSDTDCETYDGWCATGFDRDKLCHTFCWHTMECPSPLVCDVQEHTCVPPPQLTQTTADSWRMVPRERPVGCSDV